MSASATKPSVSAFARSPIAADVRIVNDVAESRRWLTIARARLDVGRLSRRRGRCQTEVQLAGSIWDVLHVPGGTRRPRR